MSKARWRKSYSIVPKVQSLKHVGGYNLTDLNTATPDPIKLLEAKKGVIARFIGVMMPIMNAYQLPLAKVHIYYDPAASTVTFNRDGSIFVNLRYYEGWRTYNFLRLCRLLIRI